MSRQLELYGRQQRRPYNHHQQMSLCLETRECNTQTLRLLVKGHKSEPSVTGFEFFSDSKICGTVLARPFVISRGSHCLTSLKMFPDSPPRVAMHYEL